MVDINRVKKDLERHEGRVPHAYRDSEGFLTIGVGHLIDERRGGRLPDFIIDALLDYDIHEKYLELDEKLPFWRTLNDPRQRVLLNMSFNLGVGGLMKFKRMIAALKRADYKAAAVEMLDSHWAIQVGPRARELARIMETGED